MRLPERAQSLVLGVVEGEGVRTNWNLQAALAGDEAAWAAIVDEFGGTVWRWARSAGLSAEDAEDVTQDAFYLLWDRGHSIEDTRALAGWLATTTRRLAIRRQEQASRQTSIAFNEAHERIMPSNSAPGPESAAEGNELKARLYDAFARLSEMCRSLLSLCWEPNVSYDEIASLLDMAVGSIGPTRQRCLQNLRVEAGLT